jgi:hypothetical protein
MILLYRLQFEKLLRKVVCHRPKSLTSIPSVSVAFKQVCGSLGVTVDTDKNVEAIDQTLTCISGAIKSVPHAKGELSCVNC